MAFSVLAYSAGSNSTAMLAGLHQRGIPVDLIFVRFSRNQTCPAAAMTVEKGDENGNY